MLWSEKTLNTYIHDHHLREGYAKKSLPHFRASHNFSTVLSHINTEMKAFSSRVNKCALIQGESGLGGNLIC